jgi:hypothetical protein
MDVNCSLAHLKQVTTDVLHKIHVTMVGLSMATGHHHNCHHDVNTTKRQPIEIHQQETDTAGCQSNQETWKCQVQDDLWDQEETNPFW